MSLLSNLVKNVIKNTMLNYLVERWFPSVPQAIKIIPLTRILNERRITFPVMLMILLLYKPQVVWQGTYYGLNQIYRTLSNLQKKNTE